MSRYTKILVVVVSAGFLWACEQQKIEQTESLRPVKYMTVEYNSDKTIKTFSGVTKAELEAALSFRVSGRVDEIPVNVGSHLEKGQLVARLDAKDYLVLLEQAKAELASGIASLRSAESEYNRTISLYEKRNASKSQLDTARGSAESAEAQVRALRQQLQAAQLQHGYARLYSPEACTVASKPVKENENVSAGQAIVNVNCGNDIEVQVAVPETYIGEVNKDQKVAVIVSAIPDKKFAGVVTEVGDGGGDQISAFPVTVVLEEQHRSLRSGLAAEVEFAQRNANGERSFILPVTAVGHDDGGDFTYVLAASDENRVELAQKRSIKIKALVQGGVLVEEGLSEGERVITAGLTVIRDGMKVKAE